MFADKSHEEPKNNERGITLTKYQLTEDLAEALAQGFELILEKIQGANIPKLNSSFTEGPSFEDVLEEKKREEDEERVEKLRKSDNAREREIAEVGDKLLEKFEKALDENIEENPYDEQGHIRDVKVYIDELRSNKSLRVPKFNLLRLDLPEMIKLARGSGDILLASKLDDLSFSLPDFEV